MEPSSSREGNGRRRIPPLQDGSIQSSYQINVDGGLREISRVCIRKLDFNLLTPALSREGEGTSGWEFTCNSNEGAPRFRPAGKREKGP